MNFKLGYRPALDGLRGVCVLLVVTHHMGLPGATGGFLGVDGFFVLSGFLITTLLMEEWLNTSNIRLGSFYMRRALRLLPALLLFLAICALYTWLALDGDAALSNWHGIVLALVYLSDWAMVLLGDSFIGLGMVQHTWSLAVEEQFYLLWPLVLLAMLHKRFTPRRILAVVVLLTGVTILVRAVMIVNGAWVERVYKGFDTRADSLLIGCLLGLMLSFGIIRLTPRLLELTRPLAAASLLALAYLTITASYEGQLQWAPDPRFLYYGGFTLVALAVATVILHLMASPTGRLARALSWPPLVKVGIVSYGVYLWHYAVFFMIRTGEAGWADWPVQALRLGVTAILVLISYKYVEQPMLRLKERFATNAPRKRQAAQRLSEV